MLPTVPAPPAQLPTSARLERRERQLVARVALLTGLALRLRSAGKVERSTRAAAAADYVASQVRAITSLLSYHSHHAIRLARGGDIRAARAALRAASQAGEPIAARNLAIATCRRAASALARAA